MKKQWLLGSVMATALLSAALVAQQMPKTPAPAGASAYIVSPQNGATVPPTFKVVFGLNGMGVAPAGVQAANTGHHHLLVDGESLPDFNLPLGTQVTHFGGGQTETTLSLSPGQHTLQLILGDHLHIPHEPPVVSEIIRITVSP
ncbi:MAG: DUF4399 domain-containing protein [Pseudomonadales bacterium]|nr:DUF4399 domain-containing protein [Pseudomonadales bacterium]